MGSMKPTPPLLAMDIHGGNSDWDICGPADDPTLWLKAHWKIAGVGFHVDAYRVYRNEEHIQQLDSQGGDEANDIFEAYETIAESFDPDAGYETVTIDGCEYVIFIYPFSP